MLVLGLDAMELLDALLQYQVSLLDFLRPGLGGLAALDPGGDPSLIQQLPVSVLEDLGLARAALLLRFGPSAFVLGGSLLCLDGAGEGLFQLG